MFIVIDGNDGSGKWTQIQLLKKRFESEGKKVLVLDYPRYWNPSAYFVEKYLNWMYGREVSAKLASLFYALDRFDHSFEVKQSMSEYDIIISNRYVSASMIHQAGKIEGEKERAEFLSWLFDLEYHICWIPIPDKVIFLDVPPEVSKILIEKKEQREYIKDGKNKDIHEEDENHLRNAYDRAIDAVKTFWWEKVSCTKDWEMLPMDDITRMIIDKIV